MVVHNCVLLLCYVCVLCLCVHAMCVCGAHIYLDVYVWKYTVSIVLNECCVDICELCLYHP